MVNLGQGDHRVVCAQVCYTNGHRRPTLHCDIKNNSIHWTRTPCDAPKIYALPFPLGFRRLSQIWR
jgi:hypothetical protein